MNKERAIGRLEGQIDLLDDLLSLAFDQDPELKVLIDRSRHINNPEMVETLRTLIRARDLDDVKRMILSL